MAKRLASTVSITDKNIDNHLKRYLQAKSMSTEAADRLKRQRDSLMSYVEGNGHEDDKGHLWIETGVGRIKRERRVSTSLDEEFIEDWMKEHGLWDKVTKKVTLLDEDALYALMYDGSIPEEVSDDMVKLKESFALKVEEY